MDKLKEQTTNVEPRKSPNKTGKAEWNGTGWASWRHFFLQGNVRADLRHLKSHNGMGWRGR
jgi:hypothetical protein